MHPQVNIAIRAARQAGDIILRALNRLDKLQVQEKTPNDFVSEIDLLAEQTIVSVLTQAYPHESFLTEEQGEMVGEDPEAVWIVDPLDGTTNFLHGYPHFAVSIAKKVQGRLEHAVIYNPLTQDIFCASRGQGAMQNGHRLRIGKKAQLKGALMAANAPRMNQSSQLEKALLGKLLPEIAAVRRAGSTALDLAYVAAGYVDACLCDHFQEWDVAAGMLLVREAGGLITDFQGGNAVLEKKEIVCANPKLMKVILPCFVV